MRTACGQVDELNAEHHVLAITGIDPESAAGMAGIPIYISVYID
jgi:hypothetical protein